MCLFPSSLRSPCFSSGCVDFIVAELLHRLQWKKITKPQWRKSGMSEEEKEEKWNQTRTERKLNGAHGAAETTMKWRRRRESATQRKKRLIGEESYFRFNKCSLSDLCWFLFAAAAVDRSSSCHPARASCWSDHSTLRTRFYMVTSSVIKIFTSSLPCAHTCWWARWSVYICVVLFSFSAQFCIIIMIVHTTTLGHGKAQIFQTYS